MLTKNLDKLLKYGFAIESESASDSGDVGFMAKATSLCTIPHSKPEGNEFRRKNGNYLLTMYSPHGLPYGVIPRLLLAWITTEAVRTKCPVIVLGKSLSNFMRQLGIESSTGGKTGSITRMREQMKRLFSTTVTCSYNDKIEDTYSAFQIVKKHKTWWHPQKSEHAGVWESTLTLSTEFYEEAIKSPIPIDLRALKALKRSPLALDIYMWLTFRTSYLKSTTVITWLQLQMQFGAEYGRVRAFKESFIDALRKVKMVYSGANVTITKAGVLIAPGSPSIPKKLKRKSLLTS